MLELTTLSERRVCRLAGLSRDAFRDSPEPAAAMQALSARIIELVQVRRGFGYRRLHDLLRPEFPEVNHKKIYRLYREASLAVCRRRKVRRPPNERLPLAAASAPNAVWSMDFVSDALANGRRLKCLTVADDFTHESIDITVDHGISGAYAVRVLDRAARFRGYPRAVRTDNGPGFTSRDECLNEHWFTSLVQASEIIGEWRRDHNEARPHSSCSLIPPARFAANHRSKSSITAVPSTPCFASNH